MKIQCEAAEAVVLSCADEAALCWACDAMVHSVNTLAGNHKRFPLLSGEVGGGSDASTSSLAPKCDICKEASAKFFCLEDRAFLCLDCDVAVHSKQICLRSPKISANWGAGAKESPSLPLNQGLKTAGRAEETNSVPLFRGAGEGSSCQVGRDLDNLFMFPDFNGDLGFTEQYSSSRLKVGSLDVHTNQKFCFRPVQVLNSEGCLDQLHEFSWTVPESAPIPYNLGCKCKEISTMLQLKLSGHDHQP